MAVTIRDVAKEAGVAVSTASNVLNNIKRCYASKEVKEKIKRVAKTLGYVPNIHARRLGLQKTMTIGLAVRKLEYLGDFYFSQTLRVTMVHGGLYGYKVLVCSSTPISEGNDSFYYKNIVAECSVDGLIVVDHTFDDKDVEFLRSKKIPLFLIEKDNLCKGCGCIVRDYDHDMSIAIDLRRGLDHRNIALLCREVEEESKERHLVKSFLEVCDRKGVKKASEGIIRTKYGGGEIVSEEHQSKYADNIRQCVKQFITDNKSVTEIGRASCRERV